MKRFGFLLAISALVAFGGLEARAQMQLPGAVAPTPQGATVPSGRPPAARGGGVGQSGQRGPAGPPPRRGEETLPGRNLRYLGRQGSMVITRVGPPTQQSFTIAATGAGRRGNDIRSICTPDLNAGQTVTLKPLGRPAGLSRFEAAFPGCTMVIDLLSDAAIVTAPDGVCRFTEECIVDPTGIWGPVDREMPSDAEIERARGAADRRLNEARRTLQARLRTTPEGRAFLQEQAGFGANRERVCRNYGTSDAGLGYCALKYTEARAAALEARVATPAPAEASTARRPPSR
ncbi:hypothetical protein [Phreatobacter stygius]|uniref:DUF1311 domain-containing protein n=1 Tax=Phreatobacter stygius TaxID=1940610 RepID=A0A4D7BAS1_9HYPH|nr:hypothetical protein [Phreatobacter stygius]QCI65212.1 hypothetical protein E8M01_13925 [Phreatobacter stygius]